MIKLGVFTTHPVQYHVPLWKSLSKEKDVQLTVFYFSDHSIRGEVDPGFNRKVVWDVPLLDGYKSVFLQRNADLRRPSSVKIVNPVQLLKKHGFDWVFIQGYTHTFERQLLKIAPGMGIKVLMRGEFSEVGKRYFAKRLIRRWYLKWFYKKISAFCVIGENAKRHLLQNGVSEGKMYYSPYSVDTDLFEKQKRRFKRAVFRKRLGLTKDDFVLIFSGKLIPRKRPLLLFDALKPLAQFKNLKLIILGDGPLKKKVVTRGRVILGNRFLYQGFINQSELGKYYSASDLFVLPSDHETWGLVVNEAMQFGLPVIVSDQVGCHFDLVKSGKTGYVFPKGDAESLSGYIRQMLGNPRLARQLGRNAGKSIKFFTIKNSVNGILNALRSQADL